MSERQIWFWMIVAAVTGAAVLTGALLYVLASLLAPSDGDPRYRYDREPPRAFLNRGTRLLRASFAAEIDLLGRLIHFRLPERDGGPALTS